MRSVLCPGYFERDVLEIIELKGTQFCPYYCLLCGQQVIPVAKERKWEPHPHTVHKPKCPQSAVMMMHR